MRISLPAALFMTILVQCDNTALGLTAQVSANRSAVTTSQSKTLMGKPLLLRVPNMIGQGSDSVYRIMRIPLLVPHSKKLKSLLVRVYLSTNSANQVAPICPDYTVLDGVAYTNFENEIRSKVGDPPEIVSIYPVHQFLDAQFVHSGTTSLTLSPSYMGSSVGSASYTSSKQVAYGAEIPRCIGTFDDLLHAAAWDYYPAKEQPINMGMLNQYILIRINKPSDADSDDWTHPKLFVEPVVICNSNFKKPIYSTPHSVDSTISIDEYMMKFAGELSLEEKMFLSALSGTAEKTDDHYDLILKKQN